MIQVGDEKWNVQDAIIKMSNVYISFMVNIIADNV